VTCLAAAVWRCSRRCTCTCAWFQACKLTEHASSCRKQSAIDGDHACDKRANNDGADKQSGSSSNGGRSQADRVQGTSAHGQQLTDVGRVRWGQDQGTPGQLHKIGSGLSALANDHGGTLTGLASPEHIPYDEPDASLSAGANHQDGKMTDEDDHRHPNMLQGSGTDDQGLGQLESGSSCGHVEDSSDPEGDAAATAVAQGAEGAVAGADGDTGSLAMSLVGSTLTLGVILPVTCCLIPPAIAWSSAVIGHAAARKACSWANWR